MKVQDLLNAAVEESVGFKKWFSFCLEWEVETDHAGNIQAEELNDGGGVTIAGLTTAHDKVPSRVEDITPAKIVDVYHDNYWKPAEGLPSLLIPIMANYFLNMGQKASTRLLQRSLQDYGEGGEVVIDGIMGKKTRAACFRVYPIEDLARSVIAKAERHYQAIAVGGGKERFLQGWINRNNALAQTFLPA
jgi:lysozyme family protein